MKQWEGATLPRTCPDCHREYLVSTVEAQQSKDDVCRECWEAFGGATIEELIDGPESDYCECGAFHGEDEFSCGICSCCGLLVDINSEPV